jgi:hypothetical protein
LPVFASASKHVPCRSSVLKCALTILEPSYFLPLGLDTYAIASDKKKKFEKTLDTEYSAL